MINDMRSLKEEVTQKQDEILDGFLRDHPEYALNDSTEERGFYHKYMASQRLVREALAPVVVRYEGQLEKQRQWIDRLKWLSPAILVQEALNNLAGTSSSHYGDYRKQVISFAELWRGHFMPFLFNNRAFSKADYTDLPQFEYQPKQYESRAGLLVVGASFVVLALGFAIAGKKTSKLIIDQ